MQSVQALAEDAEYLPDTQLEHVLEVDEPVAEEYFPAAEEYFPAAQLVQLAEPVPV
jgi:hypothetical protein